MPLQQGLSRVRLVVELNTHTVVITIVLKVDKDWLTETMINDWT